MIIFINPSTLDLEIRLGPMETYAPTDEIEAIYKKTKMIKSLKEDFLNNIYDPEVKKLLDMVDKVNKKENPSLQKVAKQKEEGK